MAQTRAKRGRLPASSARAPAPHPLSPAPPAITSWTHCRVLPSGAGVTASESRAGSAPVPSRSSRAAADAALIRGSSRK